jgi:hypothetical protein
MAYRYRFINRKQLPEATWKRPGKTEWANMLDVELDRRDALALIEHLARMLSLTDDSRPLLLTWVGELTEAEDDAPNAKKPPSPEGEGG